MIIQPEKFHRAGNIYYDKLRESGTAAHDKQTWIVEIDPSDSTYLFKSTYWNNGNWYLNGDMWVCSNYMDVDDDSSDNWWNLTTSSL